MGGGVLLGRCRIESRSACRDLEGHLGSLKVFQWCDTFCVVSNRDVENVLLRNNLRIKIINSSLSCRVILCDVRPRSIVGVICQRRQDESSVLTERNAKSAKENFAALRMTYTQDSVMVFDRNTLL
jgi:hypothetical protein